MLLFIFTDFTVADVYIYGAGSWIVLTGGGQLSGLSPSTTIFFLG